MVLPRSRYEDGLASGGIDEAPEIDGMTTPFGDRRAERVSAQALPNHSPGLSRIDVVDDPRDVVAVRQERRFADSFHAFL